MNTLSLTKFLQREEDMPKELCQIIAKYANVVSYKTDQILCHYLGSKWFLKYSFISERNSIILYTPRNIYFRALEIGQFFFIESDGGITMREFHDLETYSNFNILNDFRMCNFPLCQITHDNNNKERCLGIVSEYDNFYVCYLERQEILRIRWNEFYKY
tara:strand:+ start:1466 stop:1942 length:477 start_codon:yes stop_codon:yes gene_type:complete